jgi:hypothetical protein
MDSSTGPVFSARDSTATAVCGTREPMVGSASRVSSSRLSHLIQGERSLRAAGKGWIEVLYPLTGDSAT